MKRYKPQGWTVWGIEPNLDLTRLADVEPPTVAAIAARIDAIDPVLRVAPVLTVCCYVLGPGSISRDIKARVLMAAALAEAVSGQAGARVALGRVSHRMEPGECPHS
jgi:hypothetical protein